MAVPRKYAVTAVKIASTESQANFDLSAYAADQIRRAGPGLLPGHASFIYFFLGLISVGLPLVEDASLGVAMRLVAFEGDVFTGEVIGSSSTSGARFGMNVDTRVIPGVGIVDDLVTSETKVSTSSYRPAKKRNSSSYVMIKNNE